MLKSLNAFCNSLSLLNYVVEKYGYLDLDDDQRKSIEAITSEISNIRSTVQNIAPSGYSKNALMYFADEIIEVAYEALDDACKEVDDAFEELNKEEENSEFAEPIYDNIEIIDRCRESLTSLRYDIEVLDSSIQEEEDDGTV